MPRLNNPASVAGGFATNTDMQTLLGRIPSGANVAVQYGTVTLNTPAVTGTATITSAPMTNSAVLLLGAKTNAVYASQFEGTVRVTLTNSTTVTVDRSSGGTYNVTATFVVITWPASVIASMQDASITIADTATSGTATITSVVAARALILPRGNLPSASPPLLMADTANTLTLTNATTVTATRTGNGSTHQAEAFTVVEFTAFA